MSNKKEITLIDVSTLISEWSELVSNLSLLSKENVDSSFKIKMPGEPFYNAKITLNIEFEYNQDNQWVNYPEFTLENFNERLLELKNMLLTTHKLPTNIN